MKIYVLPQKPQFMPVSLVLESQEEVNAIRTIVEFTQITQVFPILKNWYKQLQPYGTLQDWGKLRDILIK